MKVISGFLVFLSVLLGCQGPDGGTVTPELIISETQMTFGPEGGSKMVTVETATGFWRTEVSDNWLRVLPDGGSSTIYGIKVEVSVEPNYDAERSAEVRFKMDDKSAVLKVTQEKGSGTPPPPLPPSGEVITPEADKWYAFRQASEIQDGKSYLIVASGKIAVPYASDITYGYMNSTGAVENNGEIVTMGRNAFLFTASDNGFVVSQTSDGRIVFLKDDYNSFQVGSEAPGNGHEWSVEVQTGGSVLMTNIEKNKTFQYDPEYGTFAAYPDMRGIYPFLYECVREEEAPAPPAIAGIPSWLELPATKEDDGLDFYWHDQVTDGKTIRSWSFDYDPEAMLSHWVAYPLNKSLRGSGSRSDEWGLDPKVPMEQQPILYKGFRSDDGSFDRGHQLPSADRLDREANVKTFYFTNMTPQLSRLNQDSWADLEDKVREWSNSFDTLYVVTGCTVEGSTKVAYDNDGKEVTVPTGYYKALLGYKKEGSVGISSETGGYTGCAFWFDHEAYSGDFMNKSMTIADLQEKVGLDFFVNLPSLIGDDAVEKVETTKDNWWK